MSLCLRYVTVRKGERALIWNHKGDARILDGPARELLWRSRAEKLKRYFAPDGSYLEIKQLEGPQINLPGPAVIFYDPTIHESIEINKAVCVDSNHALVVYREKKDGFEKQISRDKIEDQLQTVFERKIVYGPTKYTPRADEWFHSFSWHGSGEDKDKTRKVKNSLNFTLLRVIGDQFYYNVRDVRTKDDTLLTVKLMIFFELKNVEMMLDNTIDPIADFINAACSDVISFVSTLTYEEFVNRSSVMNSLDTFSLLVSRAQTIGYKVSKVVFRGFHASDALQQMHDNAIQERTRLRLQADTESQKQQLLDTQLAKEEERSRLQHKVEREREEHRLKLNQQQHEQSFAQTRERDQVAIDKMEKMKKLGVDVTQVLVAECRNPDRWVKVDTDNRKDNVHVHMRE